MRVIIIEDEQPTAMRLQKLLLEINPEIEIMAIHDSIEASVNWFNKNDEPDLIFQDIHLADGSGFEIYNQVQINGPVIFITAYDQYALQAFQVNSLDYLLKPVKKEDLKKALKRYQQIYIEKQPFDFDYSKLAQQISAGSTNYQKRFVVRFGQTIKAINIEEIAYFFAISSNIFFITFEGRQYPVEHSLDKLEKMLDPEEFYRINRQFIISFKSIKEMYSYSKSRVKIVLEPPSEYETIASTERSGAFKKWLSGK
jgi:DNA-binding LytR/AlgR family response regulator